MANGKIDGYIGFAVRASAVIWGTDMLFKATKMPKVILYDLDLGANSLKKVRLCAERYGVPALALESGYLSATLKRKNVKVISITDSHLADAVIESYPNQNADDNNGKNGGGL